MNSKLKILLLSSALCLLISLSACNEPNQQDASASASPDMIRRAQLVGHENIQLRSQIADKDREIAALQKEVENVRAEDRRFRDEQSGVYKEMMRLMLECHTKLNIYETSK